MDAEAAKTYQHDLTVLQGTAPTMVTMPDMHLCHYITDEQLDMLSMLEDEPAREACLLMAGIAVGSLIPAFTALMKFSDNKMQAVDLFQFGLFLLSAAIAGLTGWVWKRRSTARPKMVKEIRARPKVTVRITSAESA